MKLDLFIKGELIDLLIPTREFALSSNWYSWFNDKKTTRFLEQGLFPNTREKQAEFFDNESSNGQRLFLIISDKQNYIGTVSLSFINYQKKTASIAMLIGEKPAGSKYSHLIALESMARLIEHGFTSLGLHRIDAGSHELLCKFQQKIELLGLRLEGITREGFNKGLETADAVKIAVLLKDYLKLIEIRGSYWDSAEKMDERIAKLPQIKFIEHFRKFMNTIGDDYYDKLSKL